jgi:hypothetical protein
MSQVQDLFRHAVEHDDAKPFDPPPWRAEFTDPTLD